MQKPLKPKHYRTPSRDHHLDKELPNSTTGRRSHCLLCFLSLTPPSSSFPSRSRAQHTANQKEMGLQKPRNHKYSCICYEVIFVLISSSPAWFKPSLGSLGTDPGFRANPPRTGDAQSCHRCEPNQPYSPWLLATSYCSFVPTQSNYWPQSSSALTKEETKQIHRSLKPPEATAGCKRCCASLLTPRFWPAKEEEKAPKSAATASPRAFTSFCPAAPKTARLNVAQCQHPAFPLPYVLIHRIICKGKLAMDLNLPGLRAAVLLSVFKPLHVSPITLFF